MTRVWTEEEHRLDVLGPDRTIRALRRRRDNCVDVLEYGERGRYRPSAMAYYRLVVAYLNAEIARLVGRDRA